MKPNRTQAQSIITKGTITENSHILDRHGVYPHKVQE